jgi:hypothetical protein
MFMTLFACFDDEEVGASVAEAVSKDEAVASGDDI